LVIPEGSLVHTMVGSLRRERLVKNVFLFWSVKEKMINGDDATAFTDYELMTTIGNGWLENVLISLYQPADMSKTLSSPSIVITVNTTTAKCRSR